MRLAVAKDQFYEAHNYYDTSYLSSFVKISPVFCPVHYRHIKQEAQLSQRDRAIVSVV